MSTTQEMYDVYDKHGNPTGQIASYHEVNTKGLFRLGVHVIVYTSDGQIVMQRRNAQLDFHPAEIEVSVGGGVGSGETPAHAACRELLEEIGLRVAEKDLVPIGKKKYNHTYKHNGQTYYMRSYNYFYKLQVAPQVLSELYAADGEASEIFIISKRKLKFALRRHYLRGRGRFVSIYSFWNLMVRSI